MADHGVLKTGVLNWWCSWPAEKINGFLVTQRMTYSPGEVILGTEEDRPAEMHPESRLGEVRDCILRPEDLTPRDLSPFLNESHAALKKRIESKGGEKRLVLPWFWFSHTLQSDKSFERIAFKLLTGADPDLFLLYHQGIDVVEHFFWHCWEPESFSDIPESDLEIFQNMIPAYYDRVLGRLMARAGGDCVFVVVSDHGMEATGKLPKSGDHVRSKPEGIMILHGPCIAPAGRIQGSVYDICPTILHILGLPVADDMLGNPLMQACRPEFLKQVPIRSIPSYGCRSAEKEASAASDRVLIQRLKDIGYID